MNNWLFMLQLVPLVTNLMKIAEKLLGPGTGVQKKEYVKDGIRQVAKAMISLSSGGQKETWELIDSLMEPISNLINVLAGLLFPKNE